MNEALWRMFLKSRQGEEAVVLDHDGIVLFSDIEPVKQPANGRLHFKDLALETEEDFFNLIRFSIEQPETEIAADLSFQSRHRHVRVITGDESDDRTHIFIGPPEKKKIFARKDEKR